MSTFYLGVRRGRRHPAVVTVLLSTFLISGFVVSCETNHELQDSGLVIGLLTDETSVSPTALTVALANVNSVGGVRGGLVHIDEQVIDEDNSGQQIMERWADRPRVWGAISIASAARTVQIAGRAEELQLPMISATGFERWENHQSQGEYWHYGFAPSYVSFVVGLMDAIAAERMVCPSVGFLIEAGDRDADMAKINELTEGSSISAGVLMVAEDTSPEPWTEPPDCILIESPVNFEATRWIRDQYGEAYPTLIYTDLRDANVFSADPDLVDYTTGAYVMLSSNGPVDGRNRIAFQRAYEEISSGSDRPTHVEEALYDAGMVLSVAYATSPTQEAVRANISLVATDNKELSGTEADVPLSAHDLPKTFESAVRGFDSGRTPDYRGVTGAVDFADGEPIPRQAHELREIVDLVEGDLTRVYTFRVLSESLEYM